MTGLLTVGGSLYFALIVSLMYAAWRRSRRNQDCARCGERGLRGDFLCGACRFAYFTDSAERYRMLRFYEVEMQQHMRKGHR